MKKVTVVKNSEVGVKPFILEDFIAPKENQTIVQEVSKKELKALAKELELKYDDTDIAFSKKLLNAHIKKNA